MDGDGDSNYEPMDQDVDPDTLQVQVPNELFDTKNDDDDADDDGEDDGDEIDFEVAADDLEITEFRKGAEAIDNGSGITSKGLLSPTESITISVVEPSNEDDGEDKEDGEISETQSHSDEDDNGGQYLSRSSSFRSGRRRNDINRERSPIAARKYPNPYLEFDDAKIQSRALRFGMGNANASAPVSTDISEKTSQMSEEELLNFYEICGMIVDNFGKITMEKVSPQYRLDSILIRGTNHMNTNEIFKYLYDLGQKPVAMEWVNDAMCVVIFNNKYEAATSLLKTSKPIVMDPKIVERKRSIIEASDSTKDDSNEENKPDAMAEDLDYDKLEAIPQSSITVPMPPGYVWRFGAPCEKAKGILVRFATKHDKKQEMAERFSEYYKNYGNPNKSGAGTNNNNNNNSRRYPSGHMRPRGRKKMRPESKFLDEDREDGEVDGDSSSLMVTSNSNDKNGWGQLSAMWDDEEAFQKSARDRIIQARQRSKESESSQSGISPMKRIETAKDLSSVKSVTDARDLLSSRQKRKRGSNSSDEEDNSDNNSDYSKNGDDNDLNDVNNDWKDSGSSSSFRRKRNSRVDNNDREMDWKERLSGPRMRMHADEEEERMKRRAFRRLGQKRGSGGDSGSLQANNYWGDFGRDNGSHSNNTFRQNKPPAQRRPVAERLGARRINQRSIMISNSGMDDLVDDNTFDLRQKLNMKRGGGAEEDTEDDLHALIFDGADSD